MTYCLSDRSVLYGSLIIFYVLKGLQGLLGSLILDTEYPIFLESTADRNDKILIQYYVLITWLFDTHET